jgi:magnesium-transporting ATPase (P-type)
MWNSSAFFTQVTSEMLEKQADKFKGYKAGDWATQGNVTEQAILKFFQAELGGQGCIDYKKQLDNIQETIIGFTSSRKKASIVIKTEHGYRIYCKGAPDMLFPWTTHHVGEDGSILDMNDSVEFDESLLLAGEGPGTRGTGHDVMNRTVNLFAKQALRTILMCYRDFDEASYQQLKSEHNDFETEEDREVLEQGLIGVGIWGIQDPLREGITDAINLCKIAGITVIMCTGDNLDTAIAISKNAGIVKEEDAEGENKEYTCTTGKEFRTKVGEDLLKIEDPKTKKVTESVRNMKEFAKYF